MAALIARWVTVCCLASALGGCAAVAATLGSQILAGAVAEGVACTANSEGSTCYATKGVVGGGYAVQVEYPSAAIYRGFLSVAEADGRKIVASDDAAQTLSVSYPFSWTTWGGEISVHCVADGQGARVLFEHGKHDAAYKVKKIETKMFEDTLDWLRQSAGRAYLEALKDERAQQH